MNHYTYKITNCNKESEEYGFTYIGVRSCNCLPEDDDYMGSGVLLHDKYKELGINSFSKTIISIYDSREEANDDEYLLINKLNPEYNLSYSKVFSTAEFKTYVNPYLSKILSKDKPLDNSYIQGTIHPEWKYGIHKKYLDSIPKYLPSNVSNEYLFCNSKDEYDNFIESINYYITNEDVFFTTINEALNYLNNKYGFSSSYSKLLNKDPNYLSSNNDLKNTNILQVKYNNGFYYYNYLIDNWIQFFSTSDIDLRVLERSTIPVGNSYRSLLNKNITIIKSGITNNKVGKNVIISNMSNIYGSEIGSFTKIGPFVEIQDNCKIGKSCKISSHSFICNGTTIGNNVFIGHNVILANTVEPYATDESGHPLCNDNFKLKNITIKDNAVIGSSVNILPGVTIGKNCIVGMGTTVTKDLPDNTIIYQKKSDTIVNNNYKVPLSTNKVFIENSCLTLFNIKSKKTVVVDLTNYETTKKYCSNDFVVFKNKVSQVGINGLPTSIDLLSNFQLRFENLYDIDFLYFNNLDSCIYKAWSILLKGEIKKFYWDPIKEESIEIV